MNHTITKYKLLLLIKLLYKIKAASILTFITYKLKPLDLPAHAICFQKERLQVIRLRSHSKDVIGCPWWSLNNGAIANLYTFQIPLDDSGGTTGSAGFSAWLESSVSSWRMTTILWMWWWPITSPRDSSGGTTPWPISK